MFPAQENPSERRIFSVELLSSRWPPSPASCCHLLLRGTTLTPTSIKHRWSTATPLSLLFFSADLHSRAPCRNSLSPPEFFGFSKVSRPKTVPVVGSKPPWWVPRSLLLCISLSFGMNTFRSCFCGCHIFRRSPLPPATEAMVAVGGDTHHISSESILHAMVEFLWWTMLSSSFSRLSWIVVCFRLVSSFPATTTATSHRGHGGRERCGYRTSLVSDRMHTHAHCLSFDSLCIGCVFRLILEIFGEFPATTATTGYLVHGSRWWWSYSIPYGVWNIVS